MHASSSFRVGTSYWRAKVDPSTGSPLPLGGPCNLSGQEVQGDYVTIGASRSPVLRRKVLQGLLIGAIVAAAVYAIYRVRRKRRCPRRRNGRPRRRWWHCGAGAGRNYAGDEGGSGEFCGDSVDGDQREGDGDANPAPAPLSLSTPATVPSPTPTLDLNPELHANPVVREYPGCNGGGPASEERTDEHGVSRVDIDDPDWSRTREMSFKSDSTTDDLLADVDSLIAATPAEPPGYRKVSGAEVDALVNLTHRVLRREPDALHEIAEDAASKSVAPSAKGGPLAKGEIEDSARFRDGGAGDLTSLEPNDGNVQRGISTVD